MIAYWGTLLIAGGSAAIAVLIILSLCYLCDGGTKKKQTKLPIAMRTVNTAPPVQVARPKTATYNTSTTRDDGMVILAGAGAAMATAAVFASVSGGGGGGGCGCGGGGGGVGGGCGGGGGGGGGSGGGCGCGGGGGGGGGGCGGGGGGGGGCGV